MIRILARAGLLLALLGPSVALAAYNDVSLTTSAVITANSVPLNVTGSTATIESIVVNAGSFTAVLQSGSTFSVSSPTFHHIVADVSTGKTVDICDGSQSILTFVATDVTTVTVTPSSSICSSVGSGGGSDSGGGGGGGGGGVYVPYIPPTTATTTTTTTTTTSSTPVSGLTEGQVQSILALLASFNADQAVIDKVNASLHGQATAGTGGSSSSFTRNLEIGMTGSDVTALQAFLNTHGFQITASGSGSPGNETTMFGGLTRAALAKFQAANNISPAAGYFGPKTRAFVQSM